MNFWLFWVINASAVPLQNRGEYVFDINSPFHERPKSEALAQHLIFNVQRETINRTINDKRQAAVLTPTRQVEQLLLVEFDLGTPIQNIVAEVDFFDPGLYIAQYLSGIEYNTHYHDPMNRGIFRRYNSKTYAAQEGNLLTEEKTWGIDDMYIGYHWFYRIKFLGISASRARLGLGFLNGYHVTTDALREGETNLFYQLKEKGHMDKYLFSLWIGGDDRDAKGLLILGAIDFRYAMHNFYLFPLLSGLNKEPGYFIELNAITLFQDGDYESRAIVECSVTAHLDISISTTTFPKDILLAIYGELGQLGIDPIMPCDMLKEYKIGFVFSGVEYLVPLIDIVTQRFNNGEDCATPFVASPRIAFGANVLSTLYMVFDIEQKEIALAFARTSKEVELGEHVVVWVKSTIPARHAPAYVKTTTIPGVYSIKVKNLNFTPRESQTRLPKISKVQSTVTISPKSGAQWTWGPEDSRIMAREIG